MADRRATTFDRARMADCGHVSMIPPGCDDRWLAAPNAIVAKCTVCGVTGPIDYLIPKPPVTPRPQ